MTKYEIPMDLENGWKGKVVVEVPLHHKRLAVLTTLKIQDLIPSSQVKTKADKDKAFRTNIPIMAQAYDHARELIREVDLTGPKGEKVTTQNEMETREELQHAWIIVASQYCEGFGPGKT